MKESSQLNNLQEIALVCCAPLGTLGELYQLDAVVIDRHFARTLRGKISPVTTPV